MRGSQRLLGGQEGGCFNRLWGLRKGGVSTAVGRSRRGVFQPRLGGHRGGIFDSLWGVNDGSELTASRGSMRGVFQPPESSRTVSQMGGAGSAVLHRPHVVFSVMFFFVC